MKRNDIVFPKHSSISVFYGRINRVFDDGRVEVIDAGAHIRVCYPKDLEITNDYKGYIDDAKGYTFPVRVPMPSLRKLKRWVAQYDETVWKKYRKGQFSKHTIFHD